MRWTGIAATALAAWLAAGAGTARAAAEQYAGRPITSVHFLVEGREVTDSTLTDVLETRPGQPLSMADVRETVTHLFSLSRFEEVEADATVDGNGVALRYLLVPVHPVTSISFAGNTTAPGISTGALRQAIAERYPVIGSIGRADDVARLIEDQLRERGYLHPTVTPRADISHREERATLVFTINPRERTRIGSIEVVGTPSVPEPELLQRLGVSVGAPYERDALNQKIDQFVQDRQRRGYYEARLTPSVRLADGDRVANLTLTVIPGPLVRVAFTGDPLPAEKRAELVPIEREGSADEDLLEDASKAIEDYLRGLGYRDALAPHTREEIDGELRITFDVKRGPQYRVDHVEISGNASVPLADFDASLRLRAGQSFSAAKLDADVTTIENVYRPRGFAGVRVESAVEPEAEGAPQVGVDVRLIVREGVRTLVRSVRFAGNASVPESTLRSLVGLKVGGPFFQPQMAIDRDALEAKYQDLGYPAASVEANPGLSRDGTQADVVYTVREGVRVLVGHILIVGNARTRASTIEHELQVKPGDPLSLAAINESQRRLASLGLFRRVRINELRGGNETTRDLIVSVEEAPTTTIGYGGGFDVAQVPISENGVAGTTLELAPRATFEIGRRNLFGKNRSVNFFSSAAQQTSQTGTGYGFTVYRLLGTYREPRLFNTAADAFVTAVQEQQRRASFNFSRRSVSAEVGRHLTATLSASASYQLQKTKVFDENLVDPASKPLIDRLFPQVRLSSFLASLIRDTRSDPVDPVTGHYLSASGQVAGRAIGSEVGLAKGFFTAQTFRPLPGPRRIVFAGDARLGIATGFPLKDLPASERFFAGGDTTVRGFALDTLGSAETIDKNGFPIGGNGLVIFNGELRVPLRGGLGVVGFVDTGNVFARATDLSLGELRTAVGFGVRYKSPVGPIRIDLGFKVHRQDIVPGTRESLTQLNISLGQAF